MTRFDGCDRKAAWILLPVMCTPYVVAEFFLSTEFFLTSKQFSLGNAMRWHRDEGRVSIGWGTSVKTPILFLGLSLWLFLSLSPPCLSFFVGDDVEIFGLAPCSC